MFNMVKTYYYRLIIILLTVTISNAMSVNRSHHYNSIVPLQESIKGSSREKVLDYVLGELKSRGHRSDHILVDQFNHHFLSSDGECPTWMYRNNTSTRCICGVDNYHTVKCDESTNRVYILDSHLLTFDEEQQEVIAGASIYGIYTPNDDYDNYHLVPMNKSHLNEVVCGQYNRRGRLCGECKDGYSPLVYSYNIHCKQCSHVESKFNILKFIVVAFVPLTAFYLIVVLFKFNANSPQLHGFTLCAQLISTPFILRVVLTNSYDNISAVKAMATLYGFWNLDFFRTLYPDMCLKVTTLQALALDYVIAFYPLLLILITLALFNLHSQGYRIVTFVWYPFNKCLSSLKNEWSEKASMIDVFATFLLLSYSRIMCVSFNLLIYTSIINARGEYLGRYLYYDASYKFMGKEHLPYGIIALVLFIVFNILPVLILLLYPIKWFQKFLNYFRLSHVALHTFVDSFAGSYKDGTEPGTRDCRYFAGLYLLIRILYFITYEVTLTVYFIGISGIVTIILLLLYALIQPYKPQYAIYNRATVTMIALMSINLFCSVNIPISHNKMYRATTATFVLLGIFLTLPLLYITAVTIRWAVTVLKFRLLISKVVQLGNMSDDRSEEALLTADSRENNNQLQYNTLPVN